MRSFVEQAGAVALALATGLCVPHVAKAQEQITNAVESPALRCLTRGTQSLDYPRELYDLKIGGTVTVDLTFNAPSAPPRVRVIEHADQAANELADVVKAYTLGYRLPCLSSGDAPVVLRQQFDFRPNDGRVVYWSRPSDPLEAERRRQLACVAPPDQMAVREAAFEASGTSSAVAVVRVRFTSRDEAPEVTVLDGGGSPFRIRAAQKLARNLRMPCLAGAPVEGVWFMDFRTDDEYSTLRDMGLVTFLRGIANLEDRPVSFDLDTMGCPFDVRLRLRQPYSRNLVGEIGAQNPARAPFLDWLGELRLTLPKETLAKVIGQSMTLNVPCGKITL